MRKALLLILIIGCAQPLLSASTILPNKLPPITTKDALIPLVGTEKLISINEFLRLTPKSYHELTGKKMTFSQKVDLTISRHVLKRMIRRDGTVDIDKMKKRGFFSGWHWHWGGFALGFFLSVLGPIVALFFNDDYKWDRFWTALHTAVWLGLIALIIIAIAGGGVY
jgi:hypothetical protein